jgi:predicted neuraminidase
MSFFSSDIILARPAGLVACFAFVVFASIGSVFAQSAGAPAASSDPNASSVSTSPQWAIVSQGLLFDQTPFKNCHASTIVQTTKGDLLVACFGGTQEGNKDVCIYVGRLDSNGRVGPVSAVTDISGEATGPTLVADGMVNDTLRYPCWNPVLLQKKDGQLVLFYKVGPNPSKWWGMYKTSNDNGLHWSSAQPLPEGFLGPIKNKAIQCPDGRILCPSSVELPNGHWRAHLELTDPELKHWTYVPIDTGSTFDVIQPSILLYDKGHTQVLCRSKQGSVVEAWSKNDGMKWNPLSKTMLPNPNSGTDAVSLADGKQLIVYNPGTPGKNWWNGRAVLKVAMSTDGEHWQDICTLENGTGQEYSYPAIIQTSDGLIHITYTYERKNIKHVVIGELR